MNVPQVLVGICHDLGVSVFLDVDADRLSVRYPVRDGFEEGALRSKRFRNWLYCQLFRAEGTTPTRGELSKALDLLTFEAWNKLWGDL